MYSAFVLLALAIALLSVVFIARQWRNEKFSRVLRQGKAIQLAADGQFALTDLLTRDPDFDSEQFLERVAEFQERFHAAWTSGDLVQIQGVMPPGFKERVFLDKQLQKAVLRNTEIFDVSVFDAEIVEAVNDGFYDTLYVKLAGESMCRHMHGGNNRWLSGGVNPEPYEEIWGFARSCELTTGNSPGTLEGFCPECGADLLESPELTDCPECATGLNDGSRDWMPVYFGTVDAWRPSDIPPPAANSPLAALAHLNDQVTGHFWRVRAATTYADEERLENKALPEFVQSHLAEFRPAKEGRHSYAALPQLGRIEWIGAEENGRARLRVHWRGIFVRTRVPSFVQDDHTRLSPAVDDYILEYTGADDGQWALADVQTVKGEVPCPELLDIPAEAPALERLPVVTNCEREILLQILILLLLRKGGITGRRLRILGAASSALGIPQGRLPITMRQVETQGAVLYGTESTLDDETLFRHLTRISLACTSITSPAMAILIEVAKAIGMQAKYKDILRNERRLLMEAVAKIEKAGKRRT